MNYYEFRAMTTDIMLAAEGNPKAVEAGFEAISLWIKACEQRFTRFTDTSELAALNRSAGRWFQASQDMYDLLTQAYQLVDQTSGLFDPSVLPDLEKAGYDRTIDEVKNRPEYQSKPINQNKSFSRSTKISFTSARLEPKDQSVRLQPGMRIDLGGVAKGWIAEKAAYKLAAYASGCAVSIGGDMFLLGTPEGNWTPKNNNLSSSFGEFEFSSPWQVSLEDPQDPAQILAVLNVQSPRAVATSSVVKRSWLKENRIHNHIIDPRTGESSASDWLCVTAIAPHGAQAEAFAKSLLIAGSKGASQIAVGCPHLAYIAVDKDGKLWGSENSKELLNVAEKY